MARWFPYLFLTTLFSMPFASCTCHKDLPEPPPRQLERKGGFSAALPTPKQAPAPVVVAKPTPIEPTLRPLVGTPVPVTAELPEDFPTDVPLFRDAEVFAVQQLAGNARNVLFHADGEAPEIFQYYRDSMRAENWDVTQEYQQKEQSFLSFRKGKMITNMTVSKDPRTGKKVIAIMYYEEEDLPFPEF